MFERAGSCCLRGRCYALRRALRLERVVWWAIPFFCVLLAAGEGGRLVSRLPRGAGLGSRWLVSGVFALARVFVADHRHAALGGRRFAARAIARPDRLGDGRRSRVAAPWVRSAVALSNGAEHGGLALLPAARRACSGGGGTGADRPGGLDRAGDGDLLLHSHRRDRRRPRGRSSWLSATCSRTGVSPPPRAPCWDRLCSIVAAAELTGRSVRVRQRGAAPVSVWRG